MSRHKRSKALVPVLGILSLSIGSSLACGETNPAYIARNAVDAYGSTIEEVVVPYIGNYQVVMVGEQHGTNEYPAVALDLVKGLKKVGKNVTLALEIPANFQGTIDQAVIQKDLSILANSDFFKNRFQDGRASLAMALLIMAASEDANILCFDKDWTVAAHNRDLEMAKNVTRYAASNPDRTIVLLAGSYHTRLEEYVAEPAFTPMGYYLSNVDRDSIDRSKIFSIMGRAEKGSYWACHTVNPDECGVKPFQRAALNYATAVDLMRYFLVEPALQDGHDATIFVRSTAASVPVHREISFLDRCDISSQHFDRLMEQEFWTFDQTVFGHRYLFRPTAYCKASSAALIDSYLLTHLSDVSPVQRSTLYFHAGQDYAMADTYGIAIARIQNSFNPDEPQVPEFHWNDYVSATLAFLKKDKVALVEARAKFPEPPVGRDIINVKVVDRFLRCFESSYLDAYNGMGSCPR